MVVENTWMCPLGDTLEGRFQLWHWIQKQVPPSIKTKHKKKRRCRPIAFLISPKCLLEVGTFFVYWHRVTRGKVESERRRRWPRVKARQGSIVLPESWSASRASVFIQSSMGRRRVKTNRDFLDGRSAGAAALLFPRITGELRHLFICFWGGSSQVISVGYFKASVMAAGSANLMNPDEDWTPVNSEHGPKDDGKATKVSECHSWRHFKKINEPSQPPYSVDCVSFVVVVYY